VSRGEIIKYTFPQARVWATPVRNSHRHEKIIQVWCVTRKAVQPYKEIFFFFSVYFEQFHPKSKVSFSEVVGLYCLPNKLLSLIGLHDQNLSEISNKDTVPLKLFKLCNFTIFLLISIRSMESVCKSLHRVSLLINSNVTIFAARTMRFLLSQAVSLHWKESFFRS
jgi:hypothetical protein